MCLKYNEKKSHNHFLSKQWMYATCFACTGLLWFFREAKKKIVRSSIPNIYYREKKLIEFTID